MICNAFKLDRMSPATEAKVGALMAQKIRREGHWPALPVTPPQGAAGSQAMLSTKWRKVVEYVRNNPGATRIQIAEALCMAPTSVDNHMKNARRSGLRFTRVKVLIGCQLHNTYTVAE